MLCSADLCLPVTAEAFGEALEGLLHVDTLKEKLGALAKIPAIFVCQTEVGQSVALEGDDLGEGFEPFVFSSFLCEGVSVRCVQFLHLTRG